MRSVFLKKKNTGFTLVEMLVATAVFMSVMMVAITALVSIINANKKEEAIKSVVDNVTFALDSIARNVRVGSDYHCLVAGAFVNGDVNCKTGSSALLYKTPDGTYTEYLYASSSTLTAGQGNVQRIEGCNALGASCTGALQSLTAPTSTVNITSMQFYVLGTGTQTGSDMSVYRQPRIIITAQGTILSSNGSSTTFDLQTTASQRVRQSGS